MSVVVTGMIEKVKHSVGKNVCYIAPDTHRGKVSCART